MADKSWAKSVSKTRGILGCTFKDDDSIHLPHIEQVKSYVDTNPVANLQIHKQPSTKKGFNRKKIKSMRDNNGDIMSSKDYHLKKLGLYQKGNYMKPMVLSNSIAIKKDMYANVSQKS